MINELILAGVSFFHPSVLQDSIGTETINGKIFVLHQVGEKETLYAISRRYGTTIDAILQYNPTADAGLEIGQVLKVPYISRKPLRAAEGTTHTVAAKETMFSISQAYNVSIEEIKQWNNLTSNALSIGQTIVIKKTATKPAAPSPAKPVTTSSSAKGKHTVAAKETMFSISKQYGITVQQLKDWNMLEGNELSIGQELSVELPRNDVAKTPPPVTVEVKETQPVVTEPKKETTPVVPEIRKETPVVVAEAKKESTPVQTPPPVPQPKEQTIRISENVKNTDEILQSGLAELIEGTEGNRKYLALHRTAAVGTILKVKNEMNNREVFVRVMGKLPETAMTDKLVIRISKSAYDRLGAIDPRFRVEVTYYK
ncbi:MAG: LysM peptidoglycan-binding domain-containing protein [Chryseolinea sp.]